MSAIVTPDEINQLGTFLPKLIGFVSTTRVAGVGFPAPMGPVNDFIVQHAVEIAIMEKLSDFFLPGAGGIEAFLIFALRYTHPMDAAEAAEWMRRQNTET